MFSWSKKKDSQKRGKSSRKSTEENEFGIKIDEGLDDKELQAELKRLAGVDSLPEDDINLNEGEEDEEQELLRLLGQGGKGKRPHKRAPTALNEELGGISDLTADIDLGEEDVEVDENDPDLLEELMELTNPEEAEIEDEVESEPEPEDEEKPANGATDILSVLKERLKMYKTAEAKAKESNENSRARRFARGIKTLEDLIKKAKAGKAIAEADIPPVIAMNLKPLPPPQLEVPTEMNGNMDEAANELEEGNLQQDKELEESNLQQNEEPADVMTTLMERLKLYQTAETKAKESGETMRARRFARGIKTLKGLIKDAKAGNPVAADDIPPAVALNLKPVPPPPPSDQDTLDSNDEQVEHEMSNINLTSPGDDSDSKQSEEPERNIMDVLSERLKMYKIAEAKAKESGESTRARRFGRGIKALQDLIRQATAGKPIPHDDIPPVIALNLKPAPPVVLKEEEAQESRQPDIERENLVQSTPIAFNPVDDVDLDEELVEEEEDTPGTVLEGLEQRLRFYSRCHEKAREEGNEVLASQNEKITRVYANAIKTFKNGGYVDVLKLPNPKGCPPIPIPFYVP